MDIGEEKKKIKSDPIIVPVPQREPSPREPERVDEPRPEPAQPEQEPVKV